MSKYHNYLVAFSNIFVLFFLSKFEQWVIIIPPVICSFLMHISETKHGLKGIYPFNLYSNLFLNLDRVIAYLSFFYVLYQFLFNGFEIPWIISIIALFIAFLSENIENIFKLFFSFPPIKY